MSVVERLRAFRYTTSTREIPWMHLRSVDVAAHRVSEPDLQLMKNLISLVSDCSLSSGISSSTSSADAYQLLSVLQLALQFTLWSQSILKEQLVEKQSGAAVQQINSNYVEGLERKLDASRQEAIKLREERDTFQTACRSLEHRLTQTETTIRCLEKDLEFERNRLQTLVSRMAAQKEEERWRERQHGPLAPPQPFLGEANRAHEESKATCPQCRERGHRKRWMHYRRHCNGGNCNYNRSRSVSESTSSSLPCEEVFMGKNRGREERAAFLQLLRQERMGSKQLPQPKLQPESLVLSPRQQETKPQPQPPPLSSVENDTVTIREEAALPANIMDAIHAKMEAVQTQMLASCEAVRSSLLTAVDETLRRAAEILEQTEQYVNDFRTSRTMEQARELEEVKAILVQWREDAKTMLETHLHTAVERLRVEAAQQQRHANTFSLTPVTASNGSKEAACQHCRQRLCASALSSHEAECGLRFVKCSGCGQAVVARLLARHKCPSSAQSETGSPENASLVRASSLMLQETQRELQMLLREGEEVEEDPLEHGNPVQL